MPDHSASRTPTSLQPFVFPDTAQQVRVVLVDGEPRFVVADVARLLGYRDATAAARQLRPAQQGYTDLCTPGGTQRVMVTPESGLHRLILRSSRDEAVRIQEWVEDQVLPAIRRTGGYGQTVNVSSITRRDLAVMLLEAEDARELAERRAAELEAVTAEMAPKVEAFDAFMEADGTYSMGTVANLLGLGRTTLFQRLRDSGVLQRDNRPYQRYARHFKVVGGSHDQNGHEVPHYTTYVRPSGVEFIRNRLFPPGSQLTLVS